MLKMLNGLFIIASVGALMALLFLGGRGMADHQDFMAVAAERWYLLAGFVLMVVLAIITAGKKRRSYED